MRVLFYEPFHTGHHFAYLARMLPGFADLPVELILATTPEAARSNEFHRSLGSFGDRMTMETCCTVPPRNKRIRNGWHRLAELQAAIDRIHPDHVAVLYADGLWQVATAQDLLGRRPWPHDLVVEGWLFRGGFGESGRASPKVAVERRLFRRLLNRGLFRRLHFHHEILYDFAQRIEARQQKQSPATGNPAQAGTAATDTVLTADPLVLFDLVEKRVARERLGLPLDGRIVSLSGMVSAWKGAILLLAAFRQRVESGGIEGERLLLAGPHDDEVLARLSEEPFAAWRRDGCIVSLNRFLSEEEMFLASAASDLVTAPYVNHPGRSSVMLWASAAGRPVLGVDRGCIAHVIDGEGLGWTCAVHDGSAFAKAIDKALTQPWSTADAARVRRYAEFHNMENYQKISTELLRQRLRANHALADPAQLVT